MFGGVFYVQHLLPLDGHIFREGHGQIAWGKTQNAPEVAAASEFDYSGVLPSYLRIQANTRDISEYVSLQGGGDAK